MTDDQLQIITMIFLVKNCRMENSIILLQLMFKLIDTADKYRDDISYFEHFVYVGVAAYDTSSKNGQKLEYFIEKNYSNKIGEFATSPRY